MHDWKEHTDWTIAHRTMLLKEAASREHESHTDWTFLVIEGVVCVVLALAWLR